MGIKITTNSINNIFVGNNKINYALNGTEVFWRRPFIISFTNPTYGAWDSASEIAYYGDSIAISDTTVTCTSADDNTIRWTNTCAKQIDDSTYTYSMPVLNPNTGFTVTANITIAASDSREYIPYTITWKYLSTYPDTYSTVEEVYHYNDIPSRANPSSVINSDLTEQLVDGQWDSLAAVTADRVIEAVNYKLQYYLEFEGTRCSCTSHSTGWYDSSDTAFTATWTASDDCSFGGSTAKDTSTWSITPNQAGSYSKTAPYIYVVVSAESNTSNDKSTGWNTYNDRCTYTATTGYAFDSSGTTVKYSEYFTIPGETYSCPSAITHGKLTVDTTNCQANSSTSWQPLSNNPYTVSFTANDKYSFGGATLQDSIEISKNIPNTFRASPEYLQATITCTRCTAAVAGTNWVSGTTAITKIGNTITYTAGSYLNIDYSFTEGTTRDTEDTESVTSGKFNYTKSADYKYIIIGTVSKGDYASTSSVSTGYRKVGTYITFSIPTDAHAEFNSTIRLGLQSTWDGSTDNSGQFTDACGSINMLIDIDDKTRYIPTLYTYVYCENGTDVNCTANWSTGYYIVGVRLTWTATTATSDIHYSFSSSSNSQYTTSHTITSPTSSYNPGGVLAKTAVPWYNCTFSGDNCTTPSDGWYCHGSEVNFTANTGEGYKYSFVNTTNIWNNNYGIYNLNIDHPGNYDLDASYIYYTVTLTGVNCSPNYESGSYLLNGTTISWTAKTATANTRYSFSTSSSEEYTKNSGTVSSAGQTINGPTIHIWYYVTVTPAAHTTSSNTGSDWMVENVSIAFWADTNYAFDDEGLNEIHETVLGPGEFDCPTADYGYYNITGSHFSIISGDRAGWYLTSHELDTSVTVEYDYAYDASPTYTRRHNGVYAPHTWDATPGYGYYHLSLTRCEYASGTKAGWYPVGLYKTTTVSSQGYGFDDTGHPSTTTIGATVPGTAYASANWCYYDFAPGSNCSKTSGNDAGWYAWDALVTTTVTASSGYAFNSSGLTTATFNEHLNDRSYWRPSPTYGYLTINYSHSSYYSGTRAGWQLLSGNPYTTTAEVNDSDYAFTSYGSQRKVFNQLYVPCTLNIDPEYGLLSVTAGDHCSYSSNTPNGSYQLRSGSYSYRIVADTNWSFSSTYDPEWVNEDVTVPYTGHTYNALYGKVTITWSPSGGRGSYTGYDYEPDIDLPIHRTAYAAQGWSFNEYDETETQMSVTITTLPFSKTLNVYDHSGGGGGSDS